MGGYVVKPKPDQDEYVIWSDVTESPHFVGTRQETVQWLERRQGQPYEDAMNPIARVKRADEAGTSALWPSVDSPYLGWGDSTIFQQQGCVKVENLGELARRMEQTDADVRDLIEPFEDDEDG